MPRYLVLEVKARQVFSEWLKVLCHNTGDGRYLILTDGERLSHIEVHGFPQDCFRVELVAGHHKPGVLLEAQAASHVPLVGKHLLDVVVRDRLRTAALLFGERVAAYPELVANVHLRDLAHLIALFTHDHHASLERFGGDAAKQETAVLTRLGLRHGLAEDLDVGAVRAELRAEPEHADRRPLADGAALHGADYHGPAPRHAEGLLHGHEEEAVGLALGIGEFPAGGTISCKLSN